MYCHLLTTPRWRKVPAMLQGSALFFVSCLASSAFGGGVGLFMFAALVAGRWRLRSLGGIPLGGIPLGGTPLGGTPPHAERCAH